MAERPIVRYSKKNKEFGNLAGDKVTETDSVPFTQSESGELQQAKSKQSLEERMKPSLKQHHSSSDSSTMSNTDTSTNNDSSSLSSSEEEYETAQEDNRRKRMSRSTNYNATKNKQV